jgi:tetratricopeptide (TPR) repeat protein
MALFDSLLRWLIPEPKGKGSSPGGKDKIERRASGHNSFAPSTTVPDAVPVLIADFDGADGDGFAERLVGPIGAFPGLALLRRKETLRLAGLGGSGERLASAVERGLAWIQESSAGLLVWGEISVNGIATLRILPALAEPDGTVGAIGSADAFDVPADLAGDSGRVVAAMVFAAAARSNAKGKGLTVESLRRLLAELPEPAALASAGYQPTVTGSLLLGLGHAHAADFRSGGDTAPLNRALACYRAANERLTALTTPKHWTQAQIHLATALSALAESEQRPALMAEAVAVFRGMTEILTRIELPNDWAQAQARAGAALHRLAQMEGKPAHYRDAATAYQQALTVFTQAAHPLRWSDLMHQYGVLLTALGEHTAGTAALEQAVAVFHKALNVRRRETLPLFWAQTASALGAAAFSLAKRNGDAGALREAVGCFEGALEIYGQVGQSQAIAVLQRNLQRARRLLETRGASLADDVAPQGTAKSAEPAPASAAARKK